MEFVKKCVMAECDYYKEYGECSSVCSHYLIKPVLTNYDRIRNMSILEMVMWLRCNIGCGRDSQPCGVVCDGNCKAHSTEECVEKIKQWLEQPVEE